MPSVRPWSPGPLGFLLLPGDGLLLLSRHGQLEWIDPVAERVLGGAAERLQRQPLAQAWPELAQLLEALPAPLEQGALDARLAFPAPSPEAAPLELRLFRTDTGVGVGLLQSDRQGSQDQLLHLFSTLLNEAQDSLLVTLAEPVAAPGPVIVYANEALAAQSGFGIAEMLGRSPRLFQGADTNPHTTRRFGEALRRWERAGMEVLNYTKAGSPYWIDLKVTPLANAEGWYTHWMSVQRDVTSRRSKEQQLLDHAFSDDLTGLLNRRGLLQRLEQALSQEHSLALIFCDLDRFKEVNDRFGHSVGDTLLLEIAQRLQTVLAEGHTLARLGGDEFVVLMEQVPAAAEALALAERIRGSLVEPWLHAGEELAISMSMGVALSTSACPVSVEELLRRADLTMYQVKGAGRDGIDLYDRDVDAAVQRTAADRQQLEQALRHGRLRLHVQPQVDLASGQVIGAEALVRLVSPSGQLIQPGAFIAIAERTGLIIPLERWVIREALGTLAGWQQRGLGLGLSINLSPCHLERDDLAAVFQAEQRGSGAELHQLTIEITETVLLGKSPQVYANLEALKALGVRLALDDFGTGYSSLAWLSESAIEEVKIDRSYVHRAAEDPHCKALVTGFVRVFRDMGLTVVAEGIEAQDQAELMQAMGCSIGQGYAFGRPTALDDAGWLGEEIKRAAGIEPASSAWKAEVLPLN